MHDIKLQPRRRITEHFWIYQLAQPKSNMDYSKPVQSDIYSKE